MPAVSPLAMSGGTVGMDCVPRTDGAGGLGVLALERRKR
eukprot:CAMPEP_0172594328 /NCGR_PEP_ID=MMETSP1068-20121228/13690_1 /TAXON_ID=35684 /ORGANISM="Pseudopedinella elastica, Strain CCMP716" /LENGTH=38 /DNA_ID= /DNA_START= /DNA_END= /DNA_ORIENTATION=